MTLHRASLLLLAAIGLQIGGCEKPSASPATPTPTPSTANVPTDPAQTARQSVSIPGVPLVLSIPADWNVVAPVTEGYLVGPGIRIAVTTLDYMDDTRRRLFVSEILDQRREHPYRIHARELKDADGMQVIEKVAYLDLPGDSSSKAPPATQPSQRLYWTITIFVPDQNRVIPCSLELANITEAQYEADEASVETIVKTAHQGQLPTLQ
jgi:hypothetical protein